MKVWLLSVPLKSPSLEWLKSQLLISHFNKTLVAITKHYVMTKLRKKHIKFEPISSSSFFYTFIDLNSNIISAS